MWTVKWRPKLGFKWISDLYQAFIRPSSLLGMLNNYYFCVIYEVGSRKSKIEIWQKWRRCRRRSQEHSEHPVYSMYKRSKGNKYCRLIWENCRSQKSEISQTESIGVRKIILYLFLFPPDNDEKSATVLHINKKLSKVV